MELIIWLEAPESITHGDEFMQEMAWGKLPDYAKETLGLPNNLFPFEFFKFY